MESLNLTRNNRQQGHYAPNISRRDTTRSISGGMPLPPRHGLAISDADIEVTTRAFFCKSVFLWRARRFLGFIGSYAPGDAFFRFLYPVLLLYQRCSPWAEASMGPR